MTLSSCLITEKMNMSLLGRRSLDKAMTELDQILSVGVWRALCLKKAENIYVSLFH